MQSESDEQTDISRDFDYLDVRDNGGEDHHTHQHLSNEENKDDGHLDALIDLLDDTQTTHGTNNNNNNNANFSNGVQQSHSRLGSSQGRLDLARVKQYFEDRDQYHQSGREREKGKGREKKFKVLDIPHTTKDDDLSHFRPLTPHLLAVSVNSSPGAMSPFVLGGGGSGTPIGSTLNLQQHHRPLHHEGMSPSPRIGEVPELTRESTSEGERDESEEGVLRTEEDEEDTTGPGRYAELDPSMPSFLLPGPQGLQRMRGETEMGRDTQPTSDSSKSTPTRSPNSTPTHSDHSQEPEEPTEKITSPTLNNANEDPQAEALHLARLELQSLQKSYDALRSLVSQLPGVGLPPAPHYISAASVPVPLSSTINPVPATEDSGTKSDEKEESFIIRIDRLIYRRTRPPEHVLSNENVESLFERLELWERVVRGRYVQPPA